MSYTTVNIPCDFDPDVEVYRIPLGGGFEVSKVRHKYSSGADEGLWEIALLNADTGTLMQLTPWGIEDTTIGYQDDLEVEIWVANFGKWVAEAAKQAGAPSFKVTGLGKTLPIRIKSFF